MKETLSIFITVIIFVFLIVIFPLYNYFERQDDMSYNLVLKSTTDFIDEVINTGYISQEMYTDYVSQIANTGNLYDIQLEAHRKVLTKLDKSDDYIEQFVIDYNDDIFSTQVTNPSVIDYKTIKNGVYKLNVGDKIYIKLKNSGTTMAGALFNIIVPTSSPEKIKVNYGGIVQNNTWKQAETPIFEKYNIKLTFNLNTNGDSNASYNNTTLKDGITQTLMTGSSTLKFTVPNASPTRTNCNFKGWTTNSTSNTVEVMPGGDITLDKSTTLYAVWEYKTINLTLNANGGNPSIQSKTLTYGNYYTILNTVTKPTRAGYTFDGWYTAATGGTKVTAGTKVTTTNNVTLYAHWKAMQITVTLNPNGGTVSPTTFTKAYKEKYGTLPTPTKPGNTFVAWYLDSGFTTKVTEATTINTATNHTLYAKWNVNTYTLTFNGNGGNSPGTKTMKYGDNLSTITSSRTGYIFDGWYTAATGGTKVDTVTGNATLYAHWKQNVYTVIFNPTGGSAVTPQTKAYGERLGTLPTTTRSGSTFRGWYTEATGGTKVTEDTIVTSDVKYFAQWDLNTYTVIFNPTGGSAVTPQTKKHGDKLGTLPTTTRSGSIFKGWYTEATGGTKVTEDTIVTSDVKYFAQWDLNTYTVIFNPTGGSAVTPQTKKHGDKLGTLPTTTRSGSTFKGWYTEATGGTKVTEDTIVTSDVKYFAQWEPKTVTAKVVNCSSLTVRESGSPDAEPVTWVQVDNIVTVLNSSGTWWQIIAPNGKTGYANSNYLELQ